MTDLWYPIATRDPIIGHPDAGPMAAGYPPRICHHTTEGSSYLGAQGAYAVTGAYPHFTDTFEHGNYRVWQHIPIDHAATALRHPLGTPETNRAHCIQIEHVGFAATSAQWSATYLDNIAILCRWIEQVTGCPAVAPYPFVNPPRLTDGQWTAAAGHLGHCHVPGNDHHDPGPFDIGRILRASAPQPGPTPDPLPPPIHFGDAMTRNDFQIPVGTDGKGWAQSDFDYLRVHSILVQGPFQNEDKPIPKFGCQNRDGKAHITLEEAPPASGPPYLFPIVVWTVDA